MRIPRKIPGPAASPQDRQAHAQVVERIRELKKEIVTVEKRAKVEGMRPIELKRLVDPLKAALQQAQGREERLRGLLIEQDRAVASLKRRG